MSARGTKSFASLNAAMLGRSAPARRMPLSFARFEAEVIAVTATEVEVIEAEILEIEVLAPDVVEVASVADVPEVVRQVERLALALGVDSPAPDSDVLPIAAAPREPGRRLAFTLRIDPVRHARLRQIVSAEGRSAQQVLIDAMDQYCARTSGAARDPLIVPLHAQTPTGNQP